MSLSNSGKSATTFRFMAALRIDWNKGRNDLWEVLLLHEIPAQMDNRTIYVSCERRYDHQWYRALIHLRHTNSRLYESLKLAYEKNYLEFNKIEAFRHLVDE